MGVRSRLAAAVVSIVLIGTTLWPLVRSPDDDGFPLSTYPMFAFARPTELTIDYAFGVTSTGERRTLRPGLVGSGEVLQVAAVISQARMTNQLPALCETIAARVAHEDALDDVTEIHIVTGTHDAVNYLVRDVRGPETQRAGCPVVRR